ncbi:MAG: cyclic nucleotide-binding protein [Gemmatimonadetes bacterium]|nr:MAG: cyclic nucleotide-binding protein [Gemmatimonadota bacterium]
MAARVSPWSKRCTGRPVREPRWYSTSRRVCLTHSNVKAAPAAPTRRAGGRWRLVSRAAVRVSLARLGPALALVLVVLVFALLTDAPARYLSPFNLRIVLSQTVIVALGAIGMTLIMISGGIDLSVGASIALTGVVAALGLAAGWPPGVATAVALVAGGLVGLGNGLLITGLRVVPFIATLGMLGIARGIAKWIAHEQTVNVPPTWVNDLLVTIPRAAWMVLPPGVWIMLALAALTATVLRRTIFGRHVFALGSNELAARACGIATDRLKLAIYGSAGVFFGLAGVMQLSRLRQGDPTVAIGTELDVIAAVVIGGGSLLGGEGSVFGSVVGALIMAFLRNGCQQMGWPNYIQEIIIGAIIVLAVALDRVRAGWAS